MDKPAAAALKRAVGMLEAVLVRQTDLHRNMLALAGAKQDAIIKGDLEKLEKTVAEERNLVAKIEEEEKNRAAIMPLVRSAVGLDETAEKLADVVKLLPDPDRSRMESVHAELKSVLEQCQIKTRHNAELLKASLEHVDAFLRTVAEAASPDANYDRKGKKGGSGPTIIDRSV